MAKSFFGPRSSFFLYLMMSVIVALCGLVVNSEAMLIGSMLLAPFLIPAISMNKMGLTSRVMYKAMILIIAGVLLAIFAGYAAVKLLNIEKETDQMKSRATWNKQDRNVSIAYYVIPVVTGFALAVAYDAADITPMIGVSIAVSILPPLVNAGMYFGRGENEKAKTSLKLGVMNVAIATISYTLVRRYLLDQLRSTYFTKLSKQISTFKVLKK